MAVPLTDAVAADAAAAAAAGANGETETDPANAAEDDAGSERA